MRSGLATRLSRPHIRFRCLSWPARIALLLLTTIITLAVVAPYFAQDPLATGTPALPPGSEHWFGTDRAGRDVFARLVNGARYSLVIGLGATALAVIVGSILGGIAATSHRLINESVMRVLDVVMAFPGIALAAVLVAVFGAGIPVLIVAIALVYIPSLTRVVRANVLAQYSEDYVSAEKVIGASRPFILVRHVAINCAAPVVVFGTVLVADAIIYEASLSFIGAGIQDPLPSWGNVLSYGRQILLSGGWWATFFPGAAILLTVLALNVLAEGLTDAWSTPRTGDGGRQDPIQGPSLGPATDKPAGETSTGLGAAMVADEAAIDADDFRGGGELDRGAADKADDHERALGRLATAVESQGPRLTPVGDDVATLLSVRDLEIRFPEHHGDAAVVDGISFEVKMGESLGLVGESGCGKSLTSLALVGLLPRQASVRGEIIYDGTDLLKTTPKGRRTLAGHEMAMIYQDAMSSLNPSTLVGTQLRHLTKRDGTRTPEELLDLVGLSPARSMRSYPHELSGGQRQRVLIAMALSRSPRLLIADEPTTALDVTVQAQVVELLGELRDELGFAMVLVSHDLGLIGELVHRVAVMYAGQLAEIGTLNRLFTTPQHHYARGLLGSVLSLEAGSPRLHQIPGVVPAPRDFVDGCRFADRCPAASKICHIEAPTLSGDPDGHEFACWHPAAHDVSTPTRGTLL